MSFLICHRLFRQLVFGTSAFCSAFQFQLLAAGRVLPSKRKGSLTFFERNSSKLTGNMSALKQRQHETKIPMMYGDLVHMTFLIVIMPRYLTLILERKDEDRTLDTGIPGIPVVPAFFPTYIFVGTCLDLIFVSLSCLGGSRVASILSYVMSVTNTFATMLLQWPLPDNGDLLRFIFVYQIIVNAANQGHGFRVKTMMTLFSFTSAVCLCYLSPLFQLADYLPWLCGSTALYLFLLYYVDLGTVTGDIDGQELETLLRRRKRVRENVATSILVGLFFFHILPGIKTIMTEPNNMAHGAFIVVRAAVYAAIELIAAGAFQQEVSAKETLQELVVDRTAQISQQKEQIVKQKDELKIAGLALHASETALAVTNGKREIVWYNPAMQRLTSSNDEVSLLHRRFEDVLTSSNADAIEFVSCFKESGLADVEIVYDKKIIQAQVSPSTAANTGEADEQRFVVVLKDITESRALEKAIKLAEDETIRSIAMNEAMETLTHELRTPLQGIMGMTSLILDNDDGSLKSDTKESLSLVMVSSRLLLTLINNILDVRKCDASMLDNLELNAVPAKGPLTDAVDFCRPLSSIHGVEVEMTYDDSPTNGSAEHAVVLSDSVRVQQIGINLVSNAIKYAPKDSTISIHSRIMALLHVEEIVDASLASGNHPLPLNNTNTVPKDMQKVLVVSVSDQGQGIDESKKSFLFKKFAQLKESKHRKNAAQVGQPSGTGLGLNLCDKFVNRMNGRIWANNNMNEDGSRGTGACFSFYLPLCESHRAETLPTMDANGVPPTAINLLAPAIFPDHKGLLTPFCPCVSQLRLLLVDDTALNLKILDKMLKRCDLDEVVLACSGGEALDVLSKQEFDLVITDIHMPNGMSGNALSEAIRDGQLKRKPAVIGLTADVSQDLHRRCTDSGMAFVIHKPITVEKLRQLFESLLATGT